MIILNISVAVIVSPRLYLYLSPVLTFLLMEVFNITAFKQICDFCFLYKSHHQRYQIKLFSHY